MIAARQCMVGSAEAEDWGLYFQAEEANCVVSMAKVGSPTNTVILEASTDGGYTWSTFYDESTSTTNAVTLANIGDRVYIRKASASSHVAFGTSGSDFRSFTLSKKAGAYGNLMSVVDSTSTGRTRTSLPASRAFQGLFKGCSNLTHAPDLVATTLTFACYYLLFYDCTSLTTSPALPATNFNGGTDVYNQMFRGCTSLTAAPSLPATTLTNSCYSYMFHGCSALASAPALNATTVPASAYDHMFTGCTSLVTASSLPATTASDYCYYAMFQNCTSLTSTPSIGMTSAGTESCRDMFNGCTNMTTPPSQLKPTTVGTGTYRGMFYNCSKLASAPTISATSADSYSFQAMFMGCVALVTAPALNITTAGTYCCAEMFRNCTNMTTPPSQLKLTSVPANAYQSMFQGCSKLASAPTISATSVGASACGNMFIDCIALKTAPALNATSLGSACYAGMFARCSALTTAPSSLPATTLQEACYQNMFLNCTALTSVPATLPATNAVKSAYYNMFNGCSSLVNGPNVKATTFGETAAQGMFANTTSLSSVTVNMETWPTATNALASWFYNTKSSGTFNCPSKLGYNPSITRGTWNCPSGWTVVNPWEFFFEAEEANAKIYFVLTGTTTVQGSLQYSTNGGSTWTNWGTYSSSHTVTLSNVGDRVYFRAQTTSGNSKFATSGSVYTKFGSPSGSGKYACYGNVGCLLRQTRTTLPTANYQFCHLFEGNKHLTKTPNFDIGSPAQHTFDYACQGCTSLTHACLSTATSNQTYVFYYMFSGCTALANISVAFTSWPTGTSTTLNWVSSVATSGAFRCPTSLGTNSSITRGTSKCPSGWTVTNY